MCIQTLATNVHPSWFFMFSFSCSRSPLAQASTLITYHPLGCLQTHLSITCKFAVQLHAENEARERKVSSGGERGGSAPGPEVPKPLEDPNVDEVVSQDLATQEVKRVRRKENDPGPPPLRQAAAATADKGASSGDRVAGSAEVTGRANGAALAQGNGPADREPKKQIEEGGEGGTGAERAAVGRSEPAGPPAGAGTTGEGKEGAAAAAAAAAADGAGKSPGADKEASVSRAAKQPNGVATSAPSTKSDAMPPAPSTAKLAPVSTAPTTDAATTTAAAASAAKESAKPSPSSSSPAGDGATSSSERGREAVQPDREKQKPGPIDREGAGPQSMEEEEKRDDAEANKGKGKEGEGEAVAAAPAPAAKRRDSCPDHALPVARTFFDYETVSGFEIRMLPEFFTGRSASKTPEVRT